MTPLLLARVVGVIDQPGNTMVWVVPVNKWVQGIRPVNGNCGHQRFIRLKRAGQHLRGTEAEIRGADAPSDRLPVPQRRTGIFGDQRVV